MAQLPLTPLPAKMSDLVLKRYIETFLDPERMAFQTYLMLEKLRRNKGYRSSSFKLWDYLDDKPRMRPYIISERTLKSYSHRLDELLIYWDCAYLEPESSFRRDPHRVCSIRYADLSGHLDLCPPTFYLFDKSFSWTLIRTDEPQNEIGWNCLQIGEIGSPQRRKPSPGAAGEPPTLRFVPLRQGQS